MLKYIVLTSFILLVYVAVYGTICMFKQISRIKDDQEDDLYNLKDIRTKKGYKNDIS